MSNTTVDVVKDKSFDLSTSTEVVYPSPSDASPFLFPYLPTGTWISVTHSSGGIDSLHRT
jgi:hypothetical protein